VSNSARFSFSLRFLQLTTQLRVSRRSLRFGLGLAVLCSALLCVFPIAVCAQGVSFAGSTPSVNFGNVNLCAPGQTTPAPCSETLTLTYNVTESGTLETPRVVTGGAPNLDFTLASGSTCTGSVSAGATCTVKAKFAPLYAGSRPGAVQILGAGGNVLATTPVYGYGVGPQIAFNPGTELSAYQETYPGNPNGMAVDAAGDLFVVDSGLEAVMNLAQSSHFAGL